MTKKIYAALLAVALAAPLAASAQDAGVFKVPGTDSTIKFYGYVQTDLTLDFSGRIEDIEGADWATYLPAVPSKDSLEAKKKVPQLYLTARTSRFGIQTSTPTKLGNIGVKLEGDFNAPNHDQSQWYTNSVIFRLRHAYGTVGNLLVGQTWSTFADLNSYADTVDFNGPGSTALVRNPMVRYTFDLGPGMSLALAAENTRGTQFGGPTAKFQTLPDLIAKFDYGAKWGTVSARVVTQQYRLAAITAGAYTNTDPKSYQSVAGALSGSFKVGGDTLVAYVAGGPGIGRYLLNAGENAFVVADAAGDLKGTNVFAYHVGYTHVWNPEFRSNAVWSQTFIQDPKAGGVAATGGNKDMMQLFVNTFYSFAKNAEFGVEYVFGQREEFAAPGATAVKGTMNRVNASMHYNFY